MAITSCPLSWDSKIHDGFIRQEFRHCVICLGIIAALVLGGDDRFLIAQPTDSAASIGAFKNATGFSVDPFGNAYVIDGGTSELLKFGPDGRQLGKIGGYGWEEGNFDRPADVISPNGLDVYVADYGNHRIQRFDRNLNFISSYSTRQNQEQPIQFGYPQSVDLSRFGTMFIVDGENNRIVKLTPEGTVERVFGDIGSGAGKLSSPRKVRVSADDRVYIIDGNTVVVFDVFGNYIRRLGTRSFAGIRSLAVDRRAIYILDSCKAYALGRESSIGREIDLARFHDQFYPCEILDAQFAGEARYFLTRHHLFRDQIQPEDAR